MNPHTIFNSQATIASTCRRCHLIMTVINSDEYTHPTCKPKPTKLESLAIGYRSAITHNDDEAAELTKQEIDKLDSQPPKLRESALYYAKWGWPVFGLRQVGTACSGGAKCKPLCLCPKEPATTHGFKDATTDLDKIEKFWRPHTHYNIGLATGHLFDVIDIDPRHGGVGSLLKLLDQKRLPEIHGVAATAGGGMHLYIKPTGKTNANANFKEQYPGIDFRGKGGYTVAPPSTLGQPGRSWSWITVPSPVIKRKGNS